MYSPMAVIVSLAQILFYHKSTSTEQLLIYKMLHVHVELN